jgi:AraC-like DNA-binding protein
MGMRPFNLPEDIFADKKSQADELIFHAYAAPAGAFEGRSVLNMNAVSLVISGEKTIYFAEKKVDIKADEFHFLSSGNCLVSMRLSAKTRFRSILIFFSNAMLSGFHAKYRDRIASLAGTHKADQPYLAFKKDGFINGFIASLEGMLGGGSGGAGGSGSGSGISPAMKKVKFEELMLYLLEAHPLRFLSFQCSKSALPEDMAIRRAVENNLTTNIGLEEIAFLANVSLSTFKRRFAKLYGAPPNKWILQKRMETARDLLLQGRERPSEIFHKVGYRNHSSFTQSFKQAFGLTPRAFLARNPDVRR